jgi:acyl dehydratase
MTRVFSIQDQELFARLSGDYNPIHMDPVAARRLLFGRPVAHGVHVLLWALDSWLRQKSAPLRLTKLSATFRGPVGVNDAVELRVGAGPEGEVGMEVTGQNGKLLTLKLTAEAAIDTGIVVPGTPPDVGLPRDRTASEGRSASGRLPLSLNREIAAKLFPDALRALPAEQVAGLLATTRLVGMEVPGLHSIYTGLELAASNELSEPVLNYSAEEFDDRFSLLRLKVACPGLSGHVSAAIRPAPARQATYDAVRSCVDAGEFRGERAMVIGGSRGLGEVAVKALAAGGSIASEVAARGGLADCFAYDVLKDAPNLPSLVGVWSPTLLCYFTTPFISASSAKRFDYAMFTSFCDYYVGGFVSTVGAAAALGKDLTDVLFPSTVFLDEVPPNMGEYAAAKAAGETACRFLPKMFPTVRFHWPRLPRLATDQTASLLPAGNADPVVAVLRALREMRAARNKESIRLGPSA